MSFSVLNELVKALRANRLQHAVDDVTAFGAIALEATLDELMEEHLPNKRVVPIMEETPRRIMRDLAHASQYARKLVQGKTKTWLLR